MKSVKRPSKKKKTAKKKVVKKTAKKKGIVDAPNFQISVKQVDDKFMTDDLLTVNVAAKLLGCSRNTVKNHVARGTIRGIWVCYGEPERIMLFYREDVEKLKEEKKKNLEKKLKDLEK